MRNLVVAVSLALGASSAMAADFGIGVSARSDDGTLFVPIDISKRVRLEPTVRYLSSESTSTSVIDVTSRSESKGLEVGIGAFGLHQVSEAARIYFGARVTYIDIEDTFSSSERSADGFGVAPTFGVEFVFGQHFSLGGEAGYNFQEIDTETTSTFSGALSSSEQETQGTQTRLIFRYLF
jgi:opacity protein-like surface antigen